MFDIIGSPQLVCCNGSIRRDFLKVGALGITGLTLSDLLRAQAAMGSTTKVSDKTVIWLFFPVVRHTTKRLIPSPTISSRIAARSGLYRPTSLEHTLVVCFHDWRNWQINIQSFVRLPILPQITRQQPTGCRPVTIILLQPTERHQSAPVLDRCCQSTVARIIP